MGISEHDIAMAARLSPYYIHMRRLIQSAAEQQQWDFNDEVMSRLVVTVQASAVHARGPQAVLWERLTEALDPMEDARGVGYLSKLPDSVHDRLEE